MIEPSSELHALDLLAVAPDLFFASRISALAQRSGRSVAIARSSDELARLLVTYRPRIVLIDLDARGIETRDVIRRARVANVERIIVFGPHRDLSARTAALEAGADQWISNQRLLETLTELLR